MNAAVKIEASLASAMAVAFANIEAATKSANNPHFKSKYADLGAVIDAIKPALVEQGLFFTQQPAQCEGGVAVETVLRHSSGETVSLGTVVVPVNKNDAQAYGSALTYARRYGLVTAFGVPTEDDDGNAAVAGGQSSKSAVNPPQPDLISRDDATKVISICSALGGTVQADLLAGYRVASIPELPARVVPAVLKRLDEKMAEKVAASSNAKAGFGEVLEDEIPY